MTDNIVDETVFICYYHCKCNTVVQCLLFTLYQQLFPSALSKMQSLFLIIFHYLVTTGAPSSGSGSGSSGSVGFPGSGSGGFPSGGGNVGFPGSGSGGFPGSGGGNTNSCPPIDVMSCPPSCLILGQNGCVLCTCAGIFSLFQCHFIFNRNVDFEIPLKILCFIPNRIVLICLYTFLSRS